MDSWKQIAKTVTSSRKFGWLKQRMTGSHIDQGLVNGIVEFVLHEHPIDIEKLRRSLHHQVIIELILGAYRSWIYNYLCNQCLSLVLIIKP